MSNQNIYSVTNPQDIQSTSSWKDGLVIVMLRKDNLVLETQILRIFRAHFPFNGQGSYCTPNLVLEMPNFMSHAQRAR